MLEQDREKLVNATRELYNRLEANETWPGSPLHRHNGFPLVHDILERLGLLHLGTGDYEEVFEETTEAMRNRMMSTQVSTEEEISYPTPTTIPSGYSPSESEFMEPYASQSLGSNGTLSSNPYQHTLPAMTTNEPIPSIHDSQNVAVTSQLGDGISYPWYQSPNYAVMNTPSYSPTPQYGLGLILPNYSDEFGYQTFGEFPR